LQTAYSERLEVGYRWYHAHDVTPAYCFGHGLTYSSWSYSALQVNQTAVSFTLTNSGEVPGSEVAQLYVTYPEAAGEPPRQLRGFGKVFLQPSQSTEVTLPISPRALSIWDAHRHTWAAVPGVFELAVGASSCDLRVRASLAVGIA
jgi:beta-glucosidase